MPSKKARLRCLVCRKPIRGKPRLLRLHITSQDPRLLNNARKLGLVSGTWRTGDYMEGPFHRECFKVAKLIWQIAFDTRGLSPRR